MVMVMAREDIRGDGIEWRQKRQLVLAGKPFAGAFPPYLFDFG
jgi:hypothetical protein